MAVQISHRPATGQVLPTLSREGEGMDVTKFGSTFERPISSFKDCSGLGKVYCQVAEHVERL